jgi:small-conductance mechanosensitive channel
MLLRIRKALAARFEAVAEIVGLFLSLSGAAIASLLGKLVLALILGTIALGIFFRLAGRRKQSRAGPSPQEPGWLAAMAGLLAFMEIGVLVEAVDLPVRFHQPGFALHHWLIVLAALLAACWLQLKLLRAARRAQRPARQAQRLTRQLRAAACAPCMRGAGAGLRPQFIIAVTATAKPPPSTMLASMLSPSHSADSATPITGTRVI